MLLGRLRISGKLALLAAIPLLAVAVLAVPLVLGRVSAAETAGDTARAVRVAGEMGSVIRSIQKERLVSVAYLRKLVDRRTLVLQSAEVDDEVEDTREKLGSDAPAKLITALDKARRLSALRGGILAGKVSSQTAIDSLSVLADGMIEGLELAKVADATTPVGRQVLGLDAILRSDEATSAYVATIVQIRGSSEQEAALIVGHLTSTISVARSWTVKFKEFASPAQRALYTLADQAGASRQGGFAYISVADQLKAYAQLRFAPADFASAASFSSASGFVETKIVADIADAVSAQQRRALIAAYGIGIGTLLLFAVVGYLTILAGRGVARPLIRLTASAERVAWAAEAELVQVADDESEAVAPIALEPLDVRGEDEIGDLARAFERVRSTAVQLVERQVAGRRNVATMFGHIGRRTQNLVSRQLALIDRLEREESDPERLRSLYQLDHVSSRLGRNAGSLVVLSGASAAGDQSAPQPIGTVVRLALGEIEDYTRVELDVPDHLIVRPSIVTDLTLVLAELMENATAYSPPHTQVNVTAEATRSGAQVLIVDHGIGISAERLAEHNARLARQERLDLVPTEVLGLFVIGRLARRHNFGVTLTPTPGGGVTAVVELGERHLVARSAEPARPRTNGTARPGRTPVDGMLALGYPVFDLAALERATDAISAGQSWDAFVIRAPQIESPTVQAPSSVAWPAPDPGHSWFEKHGGPGEQPRPALPPGPAPAPAQPAAMPASASAGQLPPTSLPSGLQRRVPGAQLPPGAAVRRPDPVAAPAVAPADPAAARELVEAFEAGVREAEGDLAPDPTIPVRRPRPPAQPGPPGWATPPAPTPPAPTAWQPPPPANGLARRVPGAALGDLSRPTGPAPAPSTMRTGPADARAAQAAIEQIEAGVRRARPETVDDRMHEGRAR